MTPDHLAEAVERAFDQACGVWTGCDWPTSFGVTGLDLCGMTSHQALLMARATAGAEAADWREAVHWLRLIEADAESAEEAARRAAGAAARGDLTAAAREAQSAWDLEARYHPQPVWADLRDAVAGGGR
jgi:hypothetical protein